MTRYGRVQEILDTAIGGPTMDIGVHGAFWRGLTRDQFTVKTVRGLTIVKFNDGAHSPLVQALKGEAPFGADLPEPPPGALFSRMPAGLPPVPDADIAFIEKWIDEGCLEDEFSPGGTETKTVFAWRPTNAPVASSRTDDIWFASPDEGWAVNSNGQIIHTRDGGNTWEVQLQDNVYFRCIGMAGTQKGWAGTLTANRRFYQTTNGGASWQLVGNLPALAPSAICGLCVVNDQVVYGSGTNYPNRPARMIKTTDGGATWSAWEMVPWADLLVDCYFTDPLHGWVVGGKAPAGVPPTRSNVKAVVLQTEDGGQTWTNRVAGLALPSGEWGWKIFFLTPQIGFVSLENFNDGAILKTTDGGKTWVRLPVNDPQKNANLEGVGFIDENTGWVGGWGDADFQRLSSSATTDGGVTWSDANDIGKALNRFRFFGNPVTVGYASGQTVYKYEPVAENKAAPAALKAAMAAPASRRAIPYVVERTLHAGGVTLPLPEDVSGTVTVAVYGRFGDEVKSFEAPAEKTPGGTAVRWDLKDAGGSPVPAGHYILRFTVGNEVMSVLLRLTEAGNSGMPKAR